MNVPRCRFVLDDHFNRVQIIFDHEDIEEILDANGYSNLRERRPDDPSDNLWVCDSPSEKFLNLTCVMRTILHDRLMDLLTR